MIESRERISIEESLSRVPLFRNCPRAYLRNIVDDFEIKNVDKDARIIEQADKSTEMYIILRGRVHVTFMSEEGEEFILTDMGEGDFFGEMSLIDGYPRSATVVASEPSTLAMLERDRFIETVRKEPMVAFDLLMFVVQRLRQNNEMLECFAFLDVRERLEKLLAGFVREEGSRTDNGYYRIRKLTHKELAARTGASREAVSKVMKVLSVRKQIIPSETEFLIAPDMCERAATGAGGVDACGRGCLARYPD